MSDSFFQEKSFEFDLLVSGSEEIVIAVHYNPDGDAIGSAMALSSFLKHIGKKVSVISPNEIPENLAFLYGPDEIAIFDSEDTEVKELVFSADLLVFVDQSSIKRTENMADFLKGVSKKKIVIDHHPDTDWTDFVWGATKIELSSTCELMFNLLINSKYIDNDIYKMPLDCARALFTGMITDTNNFSNSLYPSTFIMASKLLERGVDREEIHKNLYQSFSEERMRFMGYALYKKMVVNRELRYAYIVLTESDLNRFAFIQGDTEGFVNLPLAIEGIEMSALFTEKQDCIRVSLRSIGDVSVNDLSKRYFNGGGHERAAGGRLFIPIEEVGGYFERSISEFMNNR